MRKILNVLVGLIGTLLFAGGVLKLMGWTGRYEFSLTGTVLYMRSGTFLFQIIVLDLVAGGLMAFHAFSTFNFGRKKKVSRDSEEVLDKIRPEVKTLSRIKVIAGIVSILLSFFYLVKVVMMTSSMSDSYYDYTSAIIALYAFYGPLIILPIALGLRNMSIHQGLVREKELKEKVAKARERKRRQVARAR